MTRNAKSQGRKSHSKSQNCQAKILHKKDTFTLIAMNFVEEQLMIYVEYQRLPTNLIFRESKALLISKYRRIGDIQPHLQWNKGKPLAFSLHFLFRCDQNHYSSLTPQIMKTC